MDLKKRIEKLEKRVATLGEVVQEQLKSKDDYRLKFQKPKLEKPRLKKSLDDSEKLL